MSSSTGRGIVILFAFGLWLGCVGVQAAICQDSIKASSATGTIEGEIHYKADAARRWRYARYYVKDSRLAEAVVALRGSKLRTESRSREPETTIIDQKNFRFIPETLAIQAGDRVKFTNSDPNIHNVYSYSALQRFNDSLAMGDDFVQTFPRAGGIRRPISVGCRFHSGMQAWIFVFEHSFYQVSSTDGRFKLENIPAGKYRLDLLHPAGKLRWSRSVEVQPGKTLQVDIRVSPDDKVESLR